MDFNTILNTVKDYVPVPVIVAVVAVIMLVYGSMYIASVIEDAVEKHYRRQIKIFDHKKNLAECFLVCCSFGCSCACKVHSVAGGFLLLAVNSGGVYFFIRSFFEKAGNEKG